ncbi:hypothetical protein BDQ17DRAFT_1347114 [Cyathus striatus]|nr:hypothetical protein BDQ17DRAFT_1347114 [Cyathus striatus]
MTPIRYTFPQQDLMDELVNAYFEHVNLIMPLLHRPTFDRSVAQGLHLHDNGFGGCYSWIQWFNQVNVVKDKLLAVPNVYDIQMYALACQFLQGTSIPHTCWTLVGIGIRFSQDLGIHRRRVPLEQLTVELELCKRAFWVLVSLDQMASIGLGRACAVDNRALDLDMPIECDDEYWEHEDPKKRLNRIMVFALRSLYHMKRKAWDFILKDWQKPVVEEMDSALNKWLVDVPECVRWDPHRSDDKFYKVSLMLMGWYYYVQILIHRPFILSRDKTSHPFPSLTICSNAAKATKKGYPIHVHLTLFAFTSGVCTRGVDDIHKCLDLLKFSEERWYSCGKAWDTLNGLVSAQEHDNSESSSETGLPLYVGMATPQTRVTDRNRQLNNGDMRFDSVSYQNSYRDSSTYAVPHLPTSIPGNAYLIPPEGVGTLDPRHFGSYSYPSSAVFYDTNEQLPLSSADFRLLPAADVPDMPPGMDSNTMNMWMNAPTGISLEDWVEFLGEYNYGKRSNL